MTLLPFDTCELQTSLNPQEVIERLKQNIEPKQLLRPYDNGTQKKFEGWLRADRFQIRNITMGHKSLLPEIHGQIAQKGNQTHILLNISIPAISAALVILSLIGCVIYAFYLFFIHKGFSLYLLIPTGLFVFSYLITMLGYHTEAAISKENLQKMLDGHWQSPIQAGKLADDTQQPT